MARKDDLCIIRVSDASYNQKTNSAPRGILMLANKSKKLVPPMYYKWGDKNDLYFTQRSRNKRSDETGR